MHTDEKISLARLSLRGDLGKFMPEAQRLTLRSMLNGEEAEGTADLVLAASKRIAEMPVTYQQDGLGMNAVAHLHYFIGGADFYITEKDVDGGVQQAFGWASLFGDKKDGELGYISIEEITAAGAELDLHFHPQTLTECIND